VTAEEKRQVEIRSGPRKIIHVHQAEMRKGNPAIIVRTHRGSSHYRSVECDGPFTIEQSDEPLQGCGARIWITTTASVHGRSG